MDIHRNSHTNYYTDQPMAVAVGEVPQTRQSSRPHIFPFTNVIVNCN